MCDQPIATEPELIQINDDEAQRRVRCGTMLREPEDKHRERRRSERFRYGQISRSLSAPSYAGAACQVLKPNCQESCIVLSPFATGAIVAGCSFGAALVGMVLHIKLPDHHLDANSRDVVKLVMGLIATMSALVLSLLIASASSSYNQQSGELKALSIDIILLDRTLELYWLGAKAARDGLRDVVRRTHDRIWSPGAYGRRTSTRRKRKTPRKRMSDSWNASRPKPTSNG